MISSCRRSHLTWPRLSETRNHTPCARHSRNKSLAAPPPASFTTRRSRSDTSPIVHDGVGIRREHTPSPIHGASRRRGLSQFATVTANDTTLRHTHPGQVAKNSCGNHFPKMLDSLHAALRQRSIFDNSAEFRPPNLPTQRPRSHCARPVARHHRAFRSLG